MNSLVWFAVVLLIAWIILRVALAVTSGMLHLLWILAIIFVLVWLFRKITGGRGTPR